MTEITESRIPDQAASTSSVVVPIGTASPYWLETASGKRIDLANPDPAQIQIDDIAWALSRMPRFSGHTRDIHPLSVASHSLWMAMYVWEVSHSPLISLQAMLHDAHVAYTGEIPRPVKQLPGIAQQLELLTGRLKYAINRALQVSAPSIENSQLMREANSQALAMQARFHTMNRGQGWAVAEVNAVAERIGRIEPKRPLLAFEAYMTTYNIFKTRIDGLH